MADYEELLAAAQTQPTRVRRIPVPWKDFRLVLIGSLVLLLLLVLSPWLGFLGPLRFAVGPLRLVLGLVYILFVPGYCLVAALFPRDEDLDGIERLGLSLGLSIAWVPVLALILNALPWGLQMWPIVAGEIASIALFSVLALLRRKPLPVSEAFSPTLVWQPRRWWQAQPPASRRIYQFIFASLTLTALALAWTFLVPTPDEFMTEFYMLGPEGLAENFPREAAVGEEIGVTLGLVNLEQDTHIYRIEVWAVDPWTDGRRQLLKEASAIELARGSSREWPVTWQMPWTGDDQVVDIMLFDGAANEPYRSLRLWLNVKH